MKEADLQLIEAYLEGRLDTNEAAEFEQRLAQDSELAAQLQLRQQMEAHLLHRAELPAFKEKLNTIGKDFFEHPPAVPYEANPEKQASKSWWILAALLLLGLLGYLAFFYFQPSQLQPDELYNKAIAARMELQLTQKSGTNELPVLDLQNAYNQGRFQEALPLLDLYLTANPTDNAVYLAKGISLLETGQINEAQHIFEKLQTGASLYQDAGTWYLALSYLKMKDLSEAKKALHAIPTSSTYYAQSRDLLRGLE